MFQYAAAKSLARRHAVSLRIDRGAYQSHESRRFLLDRLQIPEADEAAEKNHVSARSPGFATAFLLSRLSRYSPTRRIPNGLNLYIEPYFQFDSRFLSLGPSSSLFGHFQSERYFSEIATDLRSDFRLKDSLSDQAQLFLDRIKSAPMPVSVHVRRGDYSKSAATGQVHGVLPADYYASALRIVERMTGREPTVFLFSDDLDAACAMFDFFPKERLIPVRANADSAWEDMALMAECSHHIIANSTFSWWGAWLNPSTEKIVIAPRNWFTASTLREINTCDLYPAGWILI